MNLCRIGLHRWRPVKAYGSHGEVEFFGSECVCHLRRLKRQPWSCQSPRVAQQAYDWLNEKPEGRGLKLVKGGGR